jgi:DNA-binding transcriptional LysR family regulator
MTALGAQVVEHARNMLSQLNAIRELADKGRNINRGRIRLASFPSVTSTLLPGLLRDVKRLHPGIESSSWKVRTRKSRSGLPQTPLNLGWS